MATNFVAGDPVETFGLVNAPHLNGKLGRVVQVPNVPRGRLAVEFPSENYAMKLLKPANLRIKRLPLDQDDPRYYYTIPARDGSEQNCPILVENGAGHLCFACNCDLGGKFYVTADNYYFCEEHFLEDALEAQSELRYCVVCHAFVSWRDCHGVRINSQLSELYPNGKLPNGRPYQLPSYPGVAWIHDACRRCALCRAEFSLHSDRTYAIRRFNDGLYRLLCAANPGCNDGCENEWEDSQLAKKRLKEIQSMSGPEIQALLVERKVDCRDDEDKESLIRKVVVTEQKKGRKSFGYTSIGGANNLVTTRFLPGYLLRDRQCQHGATHGIPVSVGGLMMEYAVHVKSNRGAREASVGFWTSRLPLLRDDLEQRRLPKWFWSSAVSDASEEEGYFDIVCIKTCGSLIVSGIQDMLAERLPVSPASALRFLGARPLLNEFGNAATIGPSAMYPLMHRSDVRRCNCLAYVVTAAEIGVLRDKTVDVKGNVGRVDIARCALCDNTLIAPKVCSACKEVAYCNTSHQHEHWKVHKKTCKGRKKG